MVAWWLWKRLHEGSNQFMLVILERSKTDQGAQNHKPNQKYKDTKIFKVDGYKLVV